MLTSSAPSATSPSGEAVFDLPETAIYCNTAAIGGRLHAVQQAGREALSATARPWQDDPERLPRLAETLREQTAAFLGTEADALAYIPSASYGIAIAAANCRPRAGSRVVLAVGEYPSNRNVWQWLAENDDIAITAARPEPGSDWTEAICAAIDAHTSVVCIPHCYWTDGALFDLERIGRQARHVGAALIIDASQSLGALPLDWQAIQPDFVISAGFKWLLGPYGLGWLWAAPHWRQRGTPLEQTWLARSVDGGFEAMTEQLPAYRSGARRFDCGEYLHPVSLPMATAAMMQLSAWGLQPLSDALGARTAWLRAALASEGLGELMPIGHAPHLCALLPPPGTRDHIAERFKLDHIIVSTRGQGLRVAPHLHVDQQQVAILVDSLRRAIG